MCLVGGLVIRRHHTLRDIWAGIGAEAGYVSATEVLEPSWTRARTNAAGEVEVEQARLDCRFSGPPADPLVYGDVVVSHPEASSWLSGAAARDGSAAEGAAKGKHSRYPGFALPGGRLVPLSVETFGRWGSEALDFLRTAAEATCESSPQLAFLGSWGPVLLLGAWHARLSVALQKANAACLPQAGRVRGAEDFVEGHCWPGWEEGRRGSPAGRSGRRRCWELRCVRLLGAGGGSACRHWPLVESVWSADLESDVRCEF